MKDIEEIVVSNLDNFVKGICNTNIENEKHYQKLYASQHRGGAIIEMGKLPLYHDKQQVLQSVPYVSIQHKKHTHFPITKIKQSDPQLRYRQKHDSLRSARQSRSLL